MSSTMHFPASNYIDPGYLLFEDGRLSCSKLRIRKITLRQLTGGYEPVQALVPARNAVGADDRGGVFRI